MKRNKAARQEKISKRSKKESKYQNPNDFLRYLSSTRLLPQIAPSSDQRLFVEANRRCDYAIWDIARQAASENRPKAEEDANTFIATLRSLKFSKMFDTDEKKFALGHRQTLKTALYPFQLFGLGLMRNQELVNNDEARGGFLVLTPGSGKTLISLAISTLCDTKGRTLIIVPSSLRKQWWEEIAKHFGKAFRGEKGLSGHCIQLRDVKSNVGEELIKNRRITLTTPQEVRKDAESKQKLLQSLKWTRIIIDEATDIKNHNTKISKACGILEADSRWLVTATPLVNNLYEELYAYLAFLRIVDRKQVDFAKFCTKYRDGSEKEVEQNMLKITERMIRINSDGNFLGFPVCELPVNNTKRIPVYPTPWEMQIRRLLSKKTCQVLNSWFQNFGLTINTLENSDAPSQLEINERENQGEEDDEFEIDEDKPLIALIMIHRQLTDHPFLIQNHLAALFIEDDISSFEKWATSSSPGSLQARNMKLLQSMRYTMQEIEPSAIEEIPDLDDLEENATSLMSPLYRESSEKLKYGSSHGLTKTDFDYTQMIQDLRSQKFEEAFKCVFCRSGRSDHRITSCQEGFVHTCHKECYEDEMERDNQSVFKEVFCGECKKNIFEGALKPLPPFKNLSAKKLRNPKVEYPRSWMASAKKTGQVMASHKTLAAKAQIMNWMEQDQDGQIIVLTEFIDMLEILAVMCKTEGWKFRKIHGKVGIDSRNKILESFVEGEFQILIATTGTGGTGLNLTCASSLLVVDCWWHSTRSIQAAGRVYRIGQIKPTNCAFIYTGGRNGSIERLMMIMQKFKRDCIDENMPAFSMADIIACFGKLEKDENGLAHLVQYEDDDEMNSA